jgi:hypothetical protein
LLQPASAANLQAAGEGGGGGGVVQFGGVAGMERLQLRGQGGDLIPHVRGLKLWQCGERLVIEEGREDGADIVDDAGAFAVDGE